MCLWLLASRSSKTGCYGVLLSVAGENLSLSNLFTLQVFGPKSLSRKLYMWNLGRISIIGWGHLVNLDLCIRAIPCSSLKNCSAQVDQLTILCNFRSHQPPRIDCCSCTDFQLLTSAFYVCPVENLLLFVWILLLTKCFDLSGFLFPSLDV
jgi:hypothetical protein